VLHESFQFTDQPVYFHNVIFRWIGYFYIFHRFSVCLDGFFVDG